MTFVRVCVNIFYKMTYFGFLTLFVGTPLIILAGLTLLDLRRGRHLPHELGNWPPWVAIGAHILVAVLYTTPWDNYLVATRVWWYDPNLVTGIVLGWVPIEEYTFFVVQTLLAGLWLLFLARRLPAGSPPEFSSPQLRRVATFIMALVWLAVMGVWLSGWRPATYLVLELGWALPPIMLQLAFGADILWRYRRLILWSVIPTTLYLSAADALAIGSGTWTINPALSLEIYLGGILPLEEFIFFGLTNMLVTFGMVLVLARQSQTRLNQEIRYRLARRWRGAWGE